MLGWILADGSQMLRLQIVFCSWYRVGGFQSPLGADWLCLGPLVRSIGDEEFAGSGEDGRPDDLVRMVLVQTWVVEASADAAVCLDKG